ncbi:MAG: tetratricopeptide repeat protein [Pseudomonadota bacterium]
MRYIALLLLALLMMPNDLVSAWSRNKGPGRRDAGKSDNTEQDRLEKDSAVSGEKRAGRVKSMLDEAEESAREGSTKHEMDQSASLAMEALQIAQEKNLPAGIARAYLILGLVSLWRSDYDKALKYNNKAMRAAQRAGNLTASAAALKNTGNVYRAWGQYDKAAESYSQAVRIADKVGDKSLKAWTLLNRGQLHNYQGKYEDALKTLEEGLLLASQIGNREIEGHIRSDMGVAFTRTGRYPKAAAHFQSALAIGETTNKPRLRLEALAELGSLYAAWGKYKEAADCFRKTLEGARRYGDKRREAFALFSQAEVYAKWGRYSDAAALFQQALMIAKSTGLVLQDMRILTNMGRLCGSRGQYDKAVDLFQQALELSRKLGNAHGEGNILNNLGLVYQTRGQYDQALIHFEEAREIFRKAGVPTRSVASHIGNLYLDLGSIEKAEPFIREAGFPALQGRLFLVKADYPSAKNWYEALRKSAEANREADNLFTAYTGLGAACEGMNVLPGAAEYYRRAVEHTEDLRSGLDPDERETFFDVTMEGFRRTAPYEGLARVLLKMDKPLEAFKQTEYTRARIFSELISKRGDNAGTEIPSEVREADSTLADQLSSLTKTLQNAYEKQDKAVIEAVEPQVKEVKELFAEHIRMLRSRHPLFAATRYPQPMDMEQTSLKPDERILEYHVTDSGIIIYLTEGKKIVKHLFKPIRRKEVDDLVGRFRRPLEITEVDDMDDKLKSFDFATGKRLSDLLLSDFISYLPKDCPIIIVPDDSLCVLPFEILPLNANGSVRTDKDVPYVVGSEFFGDRNPISYYQSVTALTLGRTYAGENSAGTKLLIFADPVFQMEDARCRSATEKADTATSAESTSETETEIAAGTGIPRLPLTAKLASGLSAVYGEAAECYVGLQATKERFLNRLGPVLIDYHTVVFATHGYYGKDIPDIKEPVLILTLVPPGTDGFLRMSEVAGRTMNADLVALTACRTGLGRTVSGEGTMAMGRAFQYAGAKCVLMSLWSVEQGASVGLVDSLIKHVREGWDKLEALRSARREVRRQGYDHPFFWGGFILVGEARPSGRSSSKPSN